MKDDKIVLGEETAVFFNGSLVLSGVKTPRNRLQVASDRQGVGVDVQPVIWHRLELDTSRPF